MRPLVPLLLAPLAFAIGAISATAAETSPLPADKHTAPEHGHIPVAFVLTDGAVMIDFAGPWEVFQDVMVPARGRAMADQHVFQPYTVSDTKQPLHVSGGMTVTPDYTFDDAPTPGIVVVPAQHGSSPKMLEWLRRAAARGDVVMSVCTGAYKLAQAGLLDGKPATTHHGAYLGFAHEFPKVRLERDRRFVRSDAVVYTAGGLSSGIDLALHVVETYFGRDIAAATARQMEYEGEGWKGDGRSQVDYAQPLPVHTPADAYHDGTFGNWRGTLDGPDGAMRVVLHLWPDAHGAATGSIDSLDEDMSGMRIDDVALGDGKIAFAAAGNGRFTGTFDATRRAINGTWQQGEAKLTLDLARMDASAP